MSLRVFIFLVLLGLAGFPAAAQENNLAENATPSTNSAITMVTPVITPRVAVDQSSDTDGLIAVDTPSDSDPLKPSENDNLNESGSFHPAPGVDELSPATQDPTSTSQPTTNSDTPPAVLNVNTPVVVTPTATLASPATSSIY